VRYERDRQAYCGFGSCGDGLRYGMMGCFAGIQNRGWEGLWRGPLQEDGVNWTLLVLVCRELSERVVLVVCTFGILKSVRREIRKW